MKKFNEFENESVIDILRRSQDEMLASGEIDERGDDGLFQLAGDIMAWKIIKWKSENLSKTKAYAFVSKYVHDIPDNIADDLYSAESENIETFKLDDSTWEFIGFSDGYEGYRVTLTNDNGKLRLVKHEFADEDDCNQYGMDSRLIDKLLA